MAHSAQNCVCDTFAPTSREQCWHRRKNELEWAICVKYRIRDGAFYVKYRIRDEPFCVKYRICDGAFCVKYRIQGCDFCVKYRILHEIFVTLPKIFEQ